MKTTLLASELVSEVQPGFPKHLSDSDLYQRTSWLAQEERRITLEFLHHLAEVASRKLHILRGYSSLFSYLTEELHFSEGSAHRRIQSMKALRDLPELEECLLEGRVSITAAAKMQSHFQEKAKLQGEYSVEQKRDLFQKIEGKSTRETESMIDEIRLEIANATGQELHPAETARVLAGGHMQVSFVVDRELSEMLEKLKNLIAHQNANPSYLELFKLISNLALQRLDPEERAKRSRSLNKNEKSKINENSERKEGNSKSEEDLQKDATKDLSKDFSLGTPSSPTSAEKSRAATVNNVTSRSRYIPAAVKYEVWKRDHGCCQYVDQVTGKKCSSRYGLEYEHRIPFAYRGKHSAQNLMLYCKSHNLASAVKFFGDRTQKHLRK